MKKGLVLITWIVFFTLAFSCNSGSPKAASKELPLNEKTNVYYTCPMHPEIHSDKPGTCPKCGMALVEINTPDAATIKKNNTDSLSRH